MMLFDLHCDTLHEMYERSEPLSKNGLCFDLRRFSAYSPRCQVLAVWVNDRYRGEAALARFSAVYENAAPRLRGDGIALCRSGADLEESIRSGKTPVFLALENASAFCGCAANIDRLHALGVRFVTLTWNGENELGYGAGSENKGLKPFGKTAVRRMEQLGMVADVSHLGDRGFDDMAELSERPFIATHSNARRVCDHPRNLTDAQFLEIKRRGGVAGINLYPLFLRGGPRADFDDVRRHMEHFLTLGGQNTVALGGDLDGAKLPAGFTGVESYARLYEYLLAKNMGEGLLSRIFFGNAYDFCLRALTNPPASDMI